MGTELSGKDATGRDRSATVAVTDDNRCVLVTPPGEVISWDERQLAQVIQELVLAQTTLRDRRVRSIT